MTLCNIHRLCEISIFSSSSCSEISFLIVYVLRFESKLLINFNIHICFYTTIWHILMYRSIACQDLCYFDSGIQVVGNHVNPALVFRQSDLYIHIQSFQYLPSLGVTYNGVYVCGAMCCLRFCQNTVWNAGSISSYLVISVFAITWRHIQYGVCVWRNVLPQILSKHCIERRVI